MGEEFEGLDSEIDEEGRNLTQQRVDDFGDDESPVDAEWTDAEDSEGGDEELSP